MNKSFSYPRESVEYVYFKELTAAGEVPVMAQYALMRSGSRPLEADWANLPKVEGRFAFLLPGTLDPGRYRVFVRIPAFPENSVTEVAEIEIT